MDKAQIKTLLDSYRPGTVDEQDPIFHEALQAVKSDIGLAEWFAARQSSDNVMRQKFGEMLPVSSEVKYQALLGARQVPKVTWMHWYKPVLAAAALLMLCAIIWPRVAPGNTPARKLGLQAINYSSDMPALQFVCFDASVVADWVERQPFIQKAGIRLTKSPGNMKMIGSSIAKWNGKPVAMICLQDGERMAMLYLLDGKDFPAAKQQEFVQKAGWTSKTGTIGSNVYVLTARGDREDLRYDLPF